MFIVCNHITFNYIQVKLETLTEYQPQLYMCECVCDGSDYNVFHTWTYSEKKDGTRAIYLMISTLKLLQLQCINDLYEGKKQANK